MSVKLFIFLWTSRKLTIHQHTIQHSGSPGFGDYNNNAYLPVPFPVKFGGGLAEQKHFRWPWMCEISRWQPANKETMSASPLYP